MSRIRSIHPGLWTDEEFVTLSPMARLLLIGMWNECDDKGTFVWSPLQLKMRVLPADNVDAAALLGEIETAGFVMKYEVGGKNYGAVRNFTKFQRPKKPNDIHPTTAQIRAFVGYSGEPETDNPAEVPDQFPTPSEIAPQMEEEGGRREDVKEEPNGSRASGDAPDGGDLKPEHFVEFWNTEIAPHGKRGVRDFTPERRTLVKARIAQHGLSGCQEAMTNIRGSPFLMEARGIQFDWIIQKKNFQKILEGNYNG